MLQFRILPTAENIRHFRYRAIMRLMQTILYAYMKLNIWCLRLRHSRCH